MKTRKFGKTGVEIGEIGMGCRAIGGNAFGNCYGPADDEVSVAAIKKACEMGCTFFDTADVFGHGHSEEILGRALKDVRDKVFICTKVGQDFYAPRPARNFTPLYTGFALHKSLARLQTDYIDCCFLHNPSIRMIQRGDMLEHMNAHKQIGQIRYYGVSIDTPEEGLAALEAGDPDALQLPYNLAASEGWEALFAAAKAKDCAIVAREPLGRGFLTGKYSLDAEFTEGDIRAKMKQQDKAALVAAAAEAVDGKTPAQVAIKFALAPDAVSVVIPGARNPEQVAENLASND